uniref:Terbinafine resistance locus ORF3 n=1 Tax=Leishmania major TaxID=5664 RepID=Q86MW4_LEIMA|nr:terbinafine resistance locus ORF3 [Leishmania major]
MCVCVCVLSPIALPSFVFFLFVCARISLSVQSLMTWDTSVRRFAGCRDAPAIGTHTGLPMVVRGSSAYDVGRSVGFIAADVGGASVRPATASTRLCHPCDGRSVRLTQAYPTPGPHTAC